MSSLDEKIDELQKARVEHLREVDREFDTEKAKVDELKELYVARAKRLLMKIDKLL